MDTLSNPEPNLEPMKVFARVTSKYEKAGGEIASN